MGEGDQERQRQNRLTQTSMRYPSVLASLAACMFGALSVTVPAQTYPSKPIRIIVPFPPGAFNDTLGRTIAQKFSDGGIGQAVVDNRPGAGSQTRAVNRVPACGM
jgi:tripartite-type tricarboxylate transporter receptor subunit TctC